MDKKKEIIQIAKCVFRQYGLHKTTLEDVSSRLGMKKIHCITISRVKTIWFRKFSNQNLLIL